jgi:hypothetical protein
MIINRINPSGKMISKLERKRKTLNKKKFTTFKDSGKQTLNQLNYMQQ